MTLKRTSDAAVTLIRQSLEALNRGDVQPMLDMLADDVEWHEIGRAEAVHGKPGVAARFTTPMPDADVTSELHDVVANDEHAIALVEATARIGTRTLPYRTVEIFHVRDGKVTERWAFSDDTAAITEFFAGT